ncbi:MAG: hypothetical protein Ct9H300mP11_28380 [Chloroflexota bacterium]|nr:MAG: hypothetical protein Ct9H300mP11_28380 [Chloroflexota bacterium]
MIQELLLWNSWLKRTISSGKCQTKDTAIQDWVKLGVNRARITGSPSIFWLDPNRAQDIELIKKVNKYLPPNPDTSGLEIRTMATVDAVKYTMEKKQGVD